MLRLLMAAVAAIYLAAGASAQDWAKAALEKSPRHGEWVELKHNDRKLKAFVVFPEVSKKATTVLVIWRLPATSPSPQTSSAAPPQAAAEPTNSKVATPSARPS